MTVIVLKLLHCATMKTILVPSFFFGSDFTENMLCSPPAPSLRTLASFGFFSLGSYSCQPFSTPTTLAGFQGTRKQQKMDPGPIS